MPFLPVDGAHLFYEVSGSGPPIVLVHGMTLDHRMWDDQVGALAESATVIRYDARGFGRSQFTGDAEYTHADDLWQLLDHLGIDRAVLAGLSLGGAIVLEAALAAPRRVLALALLDAVVWGVPWDDESDRQIRAVSAVARTDGLDAAREVWLRHGFFGPALRSPTVAARLAEMVADYPGRHWTEPDPHGPHPRVLDLLPTVQAPTTVVVGELDVPGFRHMADVLAADIPDARLVVVAGVGHMVAMEAPDAVSDLLRDIVRGVG